MQIVCYMVQTSRKQTGREVGFSVPVALCDRLIMCNMLMTCVMYFTQVTLILIQQSEHEPSIFSPQPDQPRPKPVLPYVGQRRCGFMKEREDLLTLSSLPGGARTRTPMLDSDEEVRVEFR